MKDLDGKVDFGVDSLENVKLMSDDPLELILNNVWRPTLTLIGKEDIPEFNESG